MKKTIFVVALGILTGVGAYYLAPQLRDANAQEADVTTNVNCDGTMQRLGGNGQARAGETHVLIAEELGLSIDELESMLDEGLTLEEIISSEGGDRATIKTMLINSIIDHINENVTDDERKVEMLENVETHVENILTHVKGSGPVGGLGRGQGQGQGRHYMNSSATE